MQTSEYLKKNPNARPNTRITNDLYAFTMVIAHMNRETMHIYGTGELKIFKMGTEIRRVFAKYR